MSRRETEIRRRIRLSIAAWAYEHFNESFMSDEEFDRESRLVDLSIDTGDGRMDKFFRANFNADTGMWVHKHPDKDKLNRLWVNYYRKAA